MIVITFTSLLSRVTTTTTTINAQWATTHKLEELRGGLPSHVNWVNIFINKASRGGEEEQLTHLFNCRTTVGNNFLYRGEPLITTEDRKEKKKGLPTARNERLPNCLFN